MSNFMRWLRLLFNPPPKPVKTPAQIKRTLATEMRDKAFKYGKSIDMNGINLDYHIGKLKHMLAAARAALAKARGIR